MNGNSVSVIIPTLNEKNSIADSVRSAVAAGAHEVIVSDGGSNDETIALARVAGANEVIHGVPGRGIQQRIGAEKATGDWLLFLHADNQLGGDCLQQIRELTDEVWGAFEQEIQCEGFKYRLLEWGNAARVRFRRMPFGDQAIFVRRDVYDQVGGFHEMTLMEDVDLSGRLRRIRRPKLLPGPVSVDARRWENRGVIRQTIRNWSIQIAYACGATPETLARWYR